MYVFGPMYANPELFPLWDGPLNGRVAVAVNPYHPHGFGASELPTRLETGVYTVGWGAGWSMTKADLPEAPMAVPTLQFWDEKAAQWRDLVAIASKVTDNITTVRATLQPGTFSNDFRRSFLVEDLQGYPRARLRYFVPSFQADDGAVLDRFTVVHAKGLMAPQAVPVSNAGSEWMHAVPKGTGWPNVEAGMRPFRGDAFGEAYALQRGDITGAPMGTAHAYDPPRPVHVEGWERLSDAQAPGMRAIQDITSDRDALATFGFATAMLQNGATGAVRVHGIVRPGVWQVSWAAPVDSPVAPSQNYAVLEYSLDRGATWRGLAGEEDLPEIRPTGPRLSLPKPFAGFSRTYQIPPDHPAINGRLRVQVGLVEGAETAVFDELAVSYVGTQDISLAAGPNALGLFKMTSPGVIDTEGWLGMLYAEEYPWVLSLAHNRWMQLHDETLTAEGSWLFMPR